jgi:ABC-type multidrug transport system ATPase subunit
MWVSLVTTSHLLRYSGGQQRRVSFAVALMHDPELLILDEPTVGVDPLLRQSIWNHLVQITKDGNKTVIITTHYIEEARQAHTVSDISDQKVYILEVILCLWVNSPRRQDLFTEQYGVTFQRLNC